MRTFRRTYCLHGYGGSTDGSIRTLLKELITVTRAEAFGEVIFPDLPFSRGNGASPDDTPFRRARCLEEALAMPWELDGSLLIGLSMGGLLAGLLAQQRGVGTVVALSAPDRLSDAIGMDPNLPLDLLATFSSTDDPVIHSRTSRWSCLTPYAFDVKELDHNHDAQRGILLLTTVGFLCGQQPWQIQSTLEEVADPDVPVHIC